MNKPTFVGIGVAAVLVVGVAWVGRAAWRTHKGLVSLHVRNASFTEVIHQLENQTHQKIQMDKKLDGLVTLNVDGQPLSAVLDKISEQTGATWSTVYAVYESKPALRELESALRGEQKVDAAGWKMIAPGGMTISGPGADALEMLRKGGGGSFTTNFSTSSGAPGRMIIRRGGSAGLSTNDLAGAEMKLPPGAVITTDDVVMDNKFSQGRPNARMQQGGSPRVIHVMRRGANGDPGSTEEEIWSAVEIMLESRLTEKLGTDFSGVPSPEAAAEAAKKVNGQVQTYYVMKKSPLGTMPGLSMNMSGLRKADSGPAAENVRLGDTNAPKVARRLGPSNEDLEAAMRQHRLEELGKLTPEQRVQRARERQALKQKM